MKQHMIIYFSSQSKKSNADRIFSLTFFQIEIVLLFRGGGTGGAGGAIAPPIFLEIGEIYGFSTPNISGLKEGAARKSL